jgi:hypothetical protein
MDTPTASIIFAPTQVALADRIAGVIEKDLPGNTSSICTSFPMIRAAAIEQTLRPRIVILLAGCRRELDLMLSAAPLLEDFPVILKVPDRCSDTLAVAHRLRPRYLMGPDIDYRELSAVIQKIFLHRRMPAPQAARPRWQALLVRIKGRTHHFFKLNKKIN